MIGGNEVVLSEFESARQHVFWATEVNLSEPIFIATASRAPDTPSGRQLPSRLGAWSFGRVQTAYLTLLDAVQASAAFPPALPAVKIDTAELRTYETEVQIREIPSMLVLIDGGVVNNLGTQEDHFPIDFVEHSSVPSAPNVLVIDASKGISPRRKLGTRSSTWPIVGYMSRLMRSYGITFESALSGQRWHRDGPEDRTFATTAEGTLPHLGRWLVDEQFRDVGKAEDKSRLRPPRDQVGQGYNTRLLRRLEWMRRSPDHIEKAIAGLSSQDIDSITFAKTIQLEPVFGKVPTTLVPLTGPHSAACFATGYLRAHWALCRIGLTPTSFNAYSRIAQNWDIPLEF